MTLYKVRVEFYEKTRDTRTLDEFWILSRDKDKLILLTKSPKDVEEQESEIYNGLIGDEKREQKFSGEFRYQTYTYDEQKFVKRDFLAQIYIELPVTITWNTIKRKWVPESLPTPLAGETEGISISDEGPVDDVSEPTEVPVIADTMDTDSSSVENMETGVGSIDTLLEPAATDSSKEE